MPTNNFNILLRHNYISLPSPDGQSGVESIATVMMNLSYYGYALNVEGYKSLTQLGPVMLAAWWSEVEKELKSITGEDRKIGDFVVYKNFPAEVLEKSAAEYWIPQIMIYWGFPKEFFTEEVAPRERMNEQPRVAVLHPCRRDTLQNILNSYCQSPARWKDQEFEDVLFLAKNLPVNVAKLAFKENLVRLVSTFVVEGRAVILNTATDVLRLAVGLSDGDVSLREKCKFISFKKPHRRFLLSLLEKCNNINEDVARRPELWKRLLHQLHPGDYKAQFPRVCQVMNDLYHGRLSTFNSKVEILLRDKQAEVLGLLSDRPGEFRRRLIHTLDLFGEKAADAFIQEAVLGKLTTAQAVSLRSFLETVSARDFRIFPPKGNWNKAQVVPARKVEEKHLSTLSKALGQLITKRIPKVKVLDSATRLIKLPNNGGEVSPYARGTVFPIPDDIQFIRSASYWRFQGRTAWFDNGWNFFSENWKACGTIAWNIPMYADGAAAFSGDPLNSQDAEGRATQLIDLYPKRLLSAGVRYAIWNVLCYSSIPFSKAEVFAALQWGEDAQKGGLFEPSRTQLALPLTGDQLTKYIVLIDMEKREMIYLDANLQGSTSSASNNCIVLEKMMPAYMEYLASLPSVHDLFRESVDEKSETQILYSDKDTKLEDVPAYVFRPENKSNKFKPVDINSLLA